MIELESSSAPEPAPPRETEPVVRRVHAVLTEDWHRNAAPESGANAQRCAALDLAAALLAYFGLQADTSRSTTSPVGNAVAQLRAGPELSAPAAGEVLAEIFGESVGQAGRRERGAVYTPNDVVNWMVSEALEARIGEGLELRRDAVRDLLSGRRAPTSAECAELAQVMQGLRALDPAAGAGAFLVGAARAISRVARQLASVGVLGVDPLLTPLQALEYCCHGFEIDPETAEIANAATLLATYEPGSPLPSGRGVVSVRNPLVSGLEHPMAPDGWDLIVMNPPYVGEKHIRTRLGAELADSLRDAHGSARDLLVHFALHGLDALREGGALSAIVSDTAFTMASATELRSLIIDQHRLHSIAWCRPFASVAVRGGILTAVKGSSVDHDSPVEWVAADNGRGLTETPRNSVNPTVLATLPSRPFFRPTNAATSFVDRWSSVDRLDEIWNAVTARRNRAWLDTYATKLEAGEWTLLGAVVRSGQGLATGDDRRYVGYVRGTPEGEAATTRADSIIETMLSAPEYEDSAAEFLTLVAQGKTEHQAALDLILRNDPLPVPGRKPFRLVDPSDVRSSPLTAREERTGVDAGPHWIPYETSDRSGALGGARWLRTNSTVIDWSTNAVALLHQRRESGDRCPVLRNQDLWFRGGVTHNRVTSYLRARKLSVGAIFSSESPVYVPLVDWLDEYSLLALLNSSLIEFAVKTFLASRNHIEVGHLRRLPVPVLDSDAQVALAGFGQAACDAVVNGDTERLTSTEATLDEYVRKLYGVSKAMKLEIVR